MGEIAGADLFDAGFFPFAAVLNINTGKARSRVRMRLRSIR
jgi:hypothetical protein